MKIWAIANQKGGVGKTTTAVSIAGVLSEMGERTLMIDLDPHGSLSVYFRLDPDAVQKSTYQLFEAQLENRPCDIRQLIGATRFTNINLLPASSAMVLDKQIGSQGGMGLVLQKALASVANEYDFAILDCAPQLGILMVNALAACEQLVIPVQTEFLALKGLERMLRTLSMIAKAKQVSVPYTILPTMYDSRTRASQVTLQSMLEHYPQWTWHSYIPIDTQIRDASKQGLPLTISAPGRKASIAYKEFVSDLLASDHGHSASKLA